jgi:large subunit ribosomal protein L23
MQTFEILKKTILTEKASAAVEKGIYTFEVAKDANKLQIKKAVEDTYGVSVEAVRTIYCIGKVKTRNTKKGPAVGKVANIKKAMVQLVAGETIDVYGAAEETEAVAAE